MIGKKKERQQATPTPAKVEGQQTARALFPIVGIGASAGGLQAFEAFFSGIPADTEPAMAFVLVQHLAPHQDSFLVDLIRRHTTMAVHAIEDGMRIEPNHVYVVPPNHCLALLNGTLQLIEPPTGPNQHLPIDFFFRSLACDQHERAVGIVLSGNGSDATQGVRAIKGEGGLAIAQAPESAEYDGMPRSAIATGLMDYTLAPAEMYAQLKTYFDFSSIAATKPVPVQTPKAENLLQKALILVRAQTGHDLSLYKPSTINRRIERRMALHQVESMEDYLKFMQQTPQEVDALFYDLLIGVTNFFRDPEAFAVLEHKIVPKLFADRSFDVAIRVWVPGCSTGEEAYSLAILIQEQMQSLNRHYKVQIFATDIDHRAIDIARAGLYPANIAADMAPERLERYFTNEPGGGMFRIQKSIRDMLVFSEQDVIKDPPFSRIDLISCRNLLIYMSSELQKKLILLFHHSLNPGGFLFLGTSETVGELDELFSVVDRKAKVYQRKEERQTGLPALFKRFPVSPAFLHTELPQIAVARSEPPRLSLQELTEQTLLREMVPAAVLVNSLGDILYIHGRTGSYLEPAPGKAGISNILRMARQGLQRDLASALRKASGEKKTVHRQRVQVKTNGDYTSINLTIFPVKASLDESTDEDFYLVVFHETPPLVLESTKLETLPAFIQTQDADVDAETYIELLKQELYKKEEHLKAANEELETSNEDLRSSNEEMQSVNEELQSTNEELETSKEELQSVNEELATVNAELQIKVADLSRANNDMNNLLAGSGIATIFVDHQLRILRFTPAATRIINLIPSDVGRPVSHLVSNLVDYDSLVIDIQEVLRTLVSTKIDVRSGEGKWYTMRIQPYRTLENVIEGAVLTFVETTELWEAREVLHRLAVVSRDAHDAITVHDLEGRILSWNPSAERMYGWTEEEALAMNIRDLIPKGQREESMATIQKLSRAEVIKPYRTQRVVKGGGVVEVMITSTPLINTAGQIYAIATTERVEGMSSL